MIWITLLALGGDLSPAYALPPPSFGISAMSDPRTGAIVLEACRYYEKQGQVCQAIGRSEGYARPDLERILGPAIARDLAQSRGTRSLAEVDWLRGSLEAGELRAFPCAEDLSANEIARLRARYGRALVACEEALPRGGTPCPSRDPARDPGPRAALEPIHRLATPIARIAEAVEREADRELLEINVASIGGDAIRVSRNSQFSVSLPAGGRAKEFVVTITKDGEAMERDFQIVSLAPGEKMQLPLQLGPGGYQVTLGELVPGSLQKLPDGSVRVQGVGRRVLTVRNDDPVDRRGMIPSARAQSDAPDIQRVAREVLAQLPADSPPEARARAIHDWVLSHLDYTLEVTGRDALTTLRAGKSLCEGYASLTAALMRAANLPTVIVTGTLQGQAHAWNEVKIGETWYALDATANDGQSLIHNGERVDPRTTRDPAALAQLDQVRHKYFLRPVGELTEHVRLGVMIY